MSGLSYEEAIRLRTALSAAYAAPFVADIEGHIWETIFGYTKGLPFVDPLSNRSKLLYDVVDRERRIGWSAKALVWAFSVGCEFELVIQRADIFKKHADLGFEKLSRESPEDRLGAALLTHWHAKVLGDAKTQGVDAPRVAILLKSLNRRSFALVDEPIDIYEPKDLTWKWTNAAKSGLQGIRKSDGFVKYRWYPGQTQFFERFKLRAGAVQLTLEPRRLPLDVAVELLDGAVRGNE